MHKIDKFIADMRAAREVDIDVFTPIHNRIMDILGWRTIPNRFGGYTLPGFRLMRWADDNTLRIAPLSGPWHEMANPWWKMGVLPPPDVQDAFFRELENEIKDDQI